MKNKTQYTAPILSDNDDTERLNGDAQIALPVVWGVFLLDFVIGSSFTLVCTYLIAVRRKLNASDAAAAIGSKLHKS